VAAFVLFRILIFHSDQIVPVAATNMTEGQTIVPVTSAVSTDRSQRGPPASNTTEGPTMVPVTSGISTDLSQQEPPILNMTEGVTIAPVTFDISTDLSEQVSPASNVTEGPTIVPVTSDISTDWSQPESLFLNVTKEPTDSSTLPRSPFGTVAPTATPVRAAKVLTIAPTSTRVLTKAPTKVSNPTDLESDLLPREVVAKNSSDRSNDVLNPVITVLAIAVGVAVICSFLVRKSGPHQQQTTAPSDSRKMREDSCSSLSSPKNPPLKVSSQSVPIPIGMSTASNGGQSLQSHDEIKTSEDALTIGGASSHFPPEISAKSVSGAGSLSAARSLLSSVEISPLDALNIGGMSGYSSPRTFLGRRSQDEAERTAYEVSLRRSFLARKPAARN